MKFKYQILIFAYGAFVFWLLTQPKLFEGTPPIPYADTVGHVVLFAGMAAVIFYGIYRSDPTRSKLLFLSAPFFGSFLYGTFLEIVQIFIPLRSFEWGDVAADGFGALAAVYIATRYVLQNRHHAEPKNF